MSADAGQLTLQIMIVDDHAIVREGLSRVLQTAGEAWQLREASGGLQALESMRRQPADLSIVDLSMPGISGLDLIKRVKAEFPRTRVLVLTMHAEEQYALRAFAAGANGYITKGSSSAEILWAVRKLVAGGAYVTPSLAEQVVLQFNGGLQSPRHARLSDRELEVLRRIVDGQRLTDIAQALCLSVKTVSSHKHRIQQKLDLPSMAALIRYGLDNGLAGEHHKSPAAAV